tara:strand:- start:1313 stop:2452 length:1140 start_codon:yes stop_codon:yes gene_type:complete
MNIPFNKPLYIGSELDNLEQALLKNKLSGDGPFGKKCQEWFQENLPCKKVLLTPSCTDALELAAMLVNIVPGDEVIMPSYTFVSTANAFVLRGAKIVFVDIRPDTMNIDEDLIEDAITSKTKVIVPVHYAGVSCNMDRIMEIAENHGLIVIEDAAQAMMGKFKDKSLGTIGHLGTYSFHETKNYTSGGEGGALLVNHEPFINNSEIIREKGTNRSAFFRGQIDKYNWVSIGSSFLPSELQAAYLWAQLEAAEEVNEARIKAWKHYYDRLSVLFEEKILTPPVIPKDCFHNAHMFYIKTNDLKMRSELIAYMSDNNVSLVFHYLPLHETDPGKKYGRFHGNDIYTSKLSERLVRLPMYYGITDQELDRVSELLIAFFKDN